MLNTLKIENFAIIKNTEIEFSEKLNVISGETGSGKSIIMKAIKFVLGSRSDKSLIRDNATKTKVQAIFDSYDSKVNDILIDFGIEPSERLIISRTLTLDGKSDIRVNGDIVTLSMLTQITQSLVDIYNQQDHFSLLDVKKHLEIIDSFDSDIPNIKQELEKEINQLNEIEKKLKLNCENIEDKEKELDLLKFQINEIKTKIFTEDELNDLMQKREYFSNGKKITDALTYCLNICSEGFQGSGIDNAMKECQTHLQQIESLDKEFAVVNERFANIKFELQDLVDDISNKLASLDFSDEYIDAIEERIDEIKDLKRKYGQELETINNSLKEFEDRVQFLENNEEFINKLNKDKENHLVAIKALCDNLTKRRKLIASNFELSIISELCDLGMKNSSFSVYFKPNLRDFPNNLTKNGCDDVEFMFSANKGQEMKSLSKIISGGELSRFMLAYKNVSNLQDFKDLLIFDEIDAGISGIIGKMLSEKLFQISDRSQIIAISHLPQIISMADSNFVVQKIITDGQTESKLNQIDGDELLKEIARVCGNGDITNTNLTLAKELVANAEEFKKSKINKN